MNIRIEATDRLFYSAGAFAFQEATTISTSTGNLTLSAAAGADVLVGDDVTILYVDGGNGHVGMLTAAHDNHALSLSWASGEMAGVTRYGARFAITAIETGSAVSGANIAAIQAVATIVGTNTQNWTDTVGVRGVHSIISNGAFTGTVIGVAAFYVENGTAGGGTVTNQYGLYIEDLTRGTNDYGIFIAGADTAAIWINSADPIHVGLAGTATGKMEWSGATSGTVTVTVVAAAGTWTMTLPAAVGTAGYQLTDAAGDGVTSWAAAGSKREYKDILGEASPQDALDRMLGTIVYRFHYRDGMGTQDTETEYVGPMADEAAWAMHYEGGVLNPVNTLGYAVLGFQAMDRRIAEHDTRFSGVEDRLEALEEANRIRKAENEELRALVEVN